MKIVLASSNPHKVKEINAIVASSGIEFILPPDGFDPVEDGQTFEENSKIKALEAWRVSKTWTLADDSGLCIKALGGNPGIYSARYAETPQKRIERILNELEGVTDREAEFVCSMTLVNPQGEIEFVTRGVCKGSITHKTAGQNGFGYDPIFLVDSKTVTMAELSDDEKNRISHRSRALSNIMEYLKKIGA